MLITFREVLCKTALTDFSLPIRGWSGPRYSLNPYRGCTHGCIYCYAPSVLHEVRPWGGFVDVKVNAPQVLTRELSSKKRGPVFISSAVDPYQPAEARYKITRRCLEVLKQRDFPLSILTRSPLVLRDAEIIAGFTRREIGFSITAYDTPKHVEPSVPPRCRRLAALRKLAETGIDTWVSIGPLLPDITDLRLEELVREIVDAGAKRVIGVPLRLAMYPTSMALVREKSTIDRFRDQQYYEWIIEKIRDLCQSYGIRSDRQDENEGLKAAPDDYPAHKSSQASLFQVLPKQSVPKA